MGRQPPPLRRCSIGHPHYNSVPARKRPYYFRRCKKVNPTNIDTLPDEVLTEILVRLSADDIYDHVRKVCRRWYHLTHIDAFVHAHLHRTSYGLLIPNFDGRNPLFLSATPQGGVEMYELGYKFSAQAVSSCNGLIVGVDCNRKDFPYIVNPARKCRFDLPRYASKGCIGYVGIAYAAASMKYKVVRTYRNCESLSILTLGVDNAWRRVDIDKSYPLNIFYDTPKTTQGFIHWVKGMTRVFTLNVETEVIKETRFPQDYENGVMKGGYCYMSTGRYLTLSLRYGDFLWHVWEMEPETGEWRKLLHNIDMEAHRCTIKQLTWNASALVPVGWVKYPEVLAFFMFNRDTCIVYNLVVDEIHRIELPARISYMVMRPVVHRNSLVWLS